MSKKMKFGEYVGAVIAGHSGATVMKIGYGYFNMEAITTAAKQIDDVVFTAQMEQRKLTRFEQLMVEILLCQAGFKNLTEANEGYQRYLSKQEDCHD